MLHVGAHFGHAASMFERSIKIHRQCDDLLPTLRSWKRNEKHLLVLRVQRNL